MEEKTRVIGLEDERRDDQERRGMGYKRMQKGPNRPPHPTGTITRHNLHLINTHQRVRAVKVGNTMVHDRTFTASSGTQGTLATSGTIHM